MYQAKLYARLSGAHRFEFLKETPIPTSDLDFAKQFSRMLLDSEKGREKPIAVLFEGAQPLFVFDAANFPNGQKLEEGEVLLYCMRSVSDIDNASKSIFHSGSYYAASVESSGGQDILCALSADRRTNERIAFAANEKGWKEDWDFRHHFALVAS